MSTPEEVQVIILLDSYWFDYGVFSTKPSLPIATPNLNQFQEEKQELEAEAEKPKLNRINTQMRKTLSDRFLSSKDFSDSSPNFVLMPQLQTILSGKETKELSDSKSITVKFCPERDKKKRKSIRERKKKGSRSLSELEFEELKGFMDLGFVFPDEDNDSKLVSIIPGLQRLGKNQVEESDSEQPLLVSRPYLSEAWDGLKEVEEEDKRKKNNPLMDWRIPSSRNEMELKNHLRFWAHTVASTVR